MADGAELILRGLQPAIQLAAPVTSFNQGVQDQNTLATQLLNNQLLQQRYSQSEQMNPLLMQEAQNKLAMQGQDVTAGQMKLDQAKQGQLIRDMQTIATEALQMPGNARRQHILGRLKTVDFAGLDENELINEIGQLDDTQLEQSLQSMAYTSGDKTTTYGAQESVIDEEGNLFLATTKRGSNGQIQPVMVPLGAAQKPVGKVSFTTSAGVSFQDQKAAEVLAKIQGAQGEAEVEREMKPETEGLTESAKQKSKNVQEWRQTQADLAISAQSGLQNTNKMLELLDQIGTGKPEAAVQGMKTFFGLQNVKAEEFGSLAGRQLLQDIKALGSNPTEGERAYLMSLMPSLERGEEVNREMLNGIKRVQQNAIRRGRWLKANPGKGAEDYIDTFGDFDETYTPTGEADNPKKRLEELRRKANL